MRLHAILHNRLRCHSLVLFAILLVTISGCLKDNEEFTPYQENIEISAFGVVVDEGNLPVEMTTVVSQGESTETDVNGVFIFDNIVVPADHANITFSKEGYFQAYKAFVPNEKNPSFSVRLLSLGQSYSISGSSGGQVNMSNDITLDFKSNSLKDGGSTYDGNVSIHSSYLNPLNENLYSQLPGEPLAVNNDGEKGLLHHFGTVFLQIRGEMNQLLSVDEANPILLQLPVPSSLLPDAPDNIDFWKLNGMNNQWEWQGKAELKDDKYEAFVLEEGIYSIQDFLEYIKLKGTVVDKNEKPTPNTLVAIQKDGSFITTKVWTDGNGFFSTYVPLKDNLIMRIEDECYDDIDEFEIGPYLTNTDLKKIKIDPGKRYWEIYGFILKCQTTDGIDNGYSIIKTETHQWVIPIKAQGWFSLQLFICPTEFKLGGKDLDSDKSIIETPFSLSNIEQELNVGILRACK